MALPFEFVDNVLWCNHVKTLLNDTFDAGFMLYLDRNQKVILFK